MRDREIECFLHDVVRSLSLSAPLPHSSLRQAASFYARLLSSRHRPSSAREARVNVVSGGEQERNHEISTG